jgi:hypothetical protein
VVKTLKWPLDARSQVRYSLHLQFPT